MSIDDYRRKLEREVEGAKKARSARTRPADPAALRARSLDKQATPAQRTEALGDLMEVDPAGREAPAEALQVLADANEAPALRVAALGLLTAAQFHAASFPQWRPRYLEALRSASKASDPTLRGAAFEALAYMKDKPAQQALIQGLTQPAQATVTPEHALRLLSVDPHAGVQTVARRLADDPPSAAVQLEARSRVLASDPDSKQRFATLVTNARQPAEARMLAATALNGLDPALLKQTAARLAAPPGLGATATAPDAASERVRQHVAALLKR